MIFIKIEIIQDQTNEARTQLIQIELSLFED